MKRICITHNTIQKINNFLTTKDDVNEICSIIGLEAVDTYHKTLSFVQEIDIFEEIA